MVPTGSRDPNHTAIERASLLLSTKKSRQFRWFKKQETVMNTQSALSVDELDVVSGGLAINAATHPGRYGDKVPPLPNGSPGTEGSSGILGPAVFGGTGILFLLLPAVF
jgi:hypothetical protein